MTGKRQSTAPRMGIFLPSLEGGGVERVYTNLANRFVASGFAVDMILLWARGPYLADLDARIRVVDLGVRSKAQAIPALARHLHRDPPEVLLSAMDIANVVALIASRLSRRRIRLVVTCHIHFSAQTRQGRRFQDWALPWLARLLYPGADRIVAVSRGVAVDLAKVLRLPEERIEVIYNPIALDTLCAKAAMHCEHPWLQEGEPPVLLSVGRLNAQKDYPTLFRAVAELRQTRDLRLIVLGEGPERAALEQLADDIGISDILAMPGFVDNPFAYMRQAHLFVLSSRWEGFGLVIVEALACGCPVLSTDCPSGPGEILEGGKYGRLTPVGDASQMAQAIEASLDAPEDPEVLMARARDFELNRIARTYLETLGLDPAL
jgi:glycosyltransferase involved in cell wall biosynthesis